MYDHVIRKEHIYEPGKRFQNRGNSRWEPSRQGQCDCRKNLNVNFCNSINIPSSIENVAAILMSSLRSSVVVTLPVPLFSAVRTLPFANRVLFTILSLMSSDPKPTVNPLNMSSPFIRESELMVLELMLLLLPIRLFVAVTEAAVKRVVFVILFLTPL
uniref:Uncharacterized protein n=1 Tax=Glossina austeni TaxID=7395 RepID=A0A1A9UFA6_GLOAU